MYSQNNDNSISLIKDYIAKHPNGKKFILVKYKHPVLGQSDELYFTKYNHKNSLAAYYKFGFDVCKKYARFKNGCIVKIDADQIYLKEKYLDIFNQMKKEKFIYSHCAYGLNGVVCDNKYLINSVRNKYGTNGGKDHFFIPNVLAPFTYFYMSLKPDERVAYEVTVYKTFMGRVMGAYNIKNCYNWFHFDSKKHLFPDTVHFKPLSDMQYNLYCDKVFPYFKKFNSPYVDLKIIREK